MSYDDIGPLTRALSSFREDPSEANLAACMSALVDAVVYLPAPPVGATATGHEPVFQIVPSLGRSVLVGEAGGTRAVWAFADRASAEGFCARAPGWLAEPVPAPVAAHLAASAGLQLLVDPAGTMLLIDQAMMSWGVCPRRPAANPAFPAAFAAWNAERQAWTRDPLAAAIVDATFYVFEAEAELGPEVTVATAYGRRFVLEQLGDVLYLMGTTDRATMAGWCAGTGCRPMALDGAGLLAVGAAFGIDVGLMIGSERALALSPDEPGWPRRSLWRSDFVA
jgi:hypothetical protein